MSRFLFNLSMVALVAAVTGFVYFTQVYTLPVDSAVGPIFACLLLSAVMGTFISKVEEFEHYTWRKAFDDLLEGLSLGVVVTVCVAFLVSQDQWHVWAGWLLLAQAPLSAIYIAVLGVKEVS